MVPVSYPDALRLLLATVSPVGTENVTIRKALNRITAAPVMAPQALPNSRRSAVDGYALGDLNRHRWHLVGSRAAGELATEALAGDEAMAVMTGGGVPENATAVVRVEGSHPQGTLLEVVGTVTPGENINEPASELVAGEPLLGTGYRVDAVRHSALCYAGVTCIEVYRPLRVGVMLSGPELLPPGSTPRPGASYECHRALLQPVLEQLGCQCTFIGPVADQPQIIRDSVEHLAVDHDLIVTSGGVSMGKYDFVRPLLHQQEFDTVLDRTRIKPGSPLLAAKRGEQLFVAMPGYPAAFLVNLLVYLIPVVKRMSGWKEAGPLWQETVVSAPLRGRAGRSDMVRVKLREGRAEPLGDQLTSHYAGFLQADGLACLDETRTEVAVGESVAVCWFNAFLNEGGA